MPRRRTGRGSLAKYQARATSAGDPAPASQELTAIHVRRPAPGIWPALLPCALIPALAVLTIAAGYRQEDAKIRLGVYIGVGLVTGLVILRQIVAMLESRDYTHNLEQLADNLQALHSNNDALLTANRQLEVMAMTDTLTGLPNRALLYDRLGQAIQVAPRSGNMVGLLLMDLDRFKEVNDTLGHLSGDLLLQQISARLHAAVGTSGVIARLGGDEFAVLLPRTELEGAVRIARLLTATLEQHFFIEGHTLDVGASIGIALFPDHGTDPSTLLRCADVAMYVAKRTQAGHALYVADADPHSARRLALLGDLRRAITQDGLLLYYQPKVELVTNQVCGVEALVRWCHPEYGIIAPDQFIPVAEQTGLIVPLTRWVLETALAQCRAWHDRGLQIGVAVNLSARTLLDPGLLDLVTELLERYALDPASLTLEITESMLVADPTRALEVLMELDAIGVRIAIDDFGTGYSSLAYLKQLPVDEVKIDKAFVLSLNSSRHSGAVKDRLIVRSVTALAHALGMEVVAEGVENQVAWDVLLGLRCNAAQGFFLSKPVPAEEIEAWLRAQPRELSLAEQA